ncbi:portal protein [uncultured Mediterranean phage uvMED]|nr:portal protein [uncultured Mediterranean phage uvMED]
MAEALTDDQVASICRSEVDGASGRAAGEISHERAEALDYYYGEPYGDETEGRSSVVTREVMETVEWILPSLARIFCDQENMIMFDPVNETDIEQAKLETEACNYVYWKQNRGFYNTYTFLKDALLSKTGILKIYWDDTQEETKEKYENLDLVQVGELLSDPNVQRELIEDSIEQTEFGLNVEFKVIEKMGSIRIEPVPPEEFGIARNARSPYVEDTNFCYHRTLKSFSELVAMGYDVELIRSLPFDESAMTEEELARRNKTDEEEPFDYVSEESMRNYFITECYIKIDRDGDDIAELLRVTLAGGNYTSGSSRLLGIEEVDHMPFATCSPILMPHKFYGLSIADITMDLQRIKSVLTRQMLDNTYLANNSRTAVNDSHVNLDDLLTSRPGGVVRYKGEGSASQYITPIPHNPLPNEAYTMMGYLDDVRRQRTGVGDETAGLGENSLSNVNTGVAALAFDAKRMKIELIARILGEVGFKDVFRLIHKLLMKHQDRKMLLNVAGNFQAINPSEWRKRENTSVQVGVGSVSRERRMVALETIMAKQNELIANGGMGTLVQPFQVYQTLRDITDGFGLQPQAYFTDPRTLPPPPPPQPDAQAELALTHARALVMDAESKMQRNQIDVAKAQAEQQIKFRELELRQQELQLKADIERQKAELVLLQRETDSDQKVASMEIQIAKQDAEKRLEALELELQTVQAEKDREVDIYKNQMNNLTKLVQQDMKAGGQDLQQVILNLQADNEMLRKQIEDLNGSEG